MTQPSNNSKNHQGNSDKSAPEINQKLIVDQSKNEGNIGQAGNNLTQTINKLFLSLITISREVKITINRTSVVTAHRRCHPIIVFIIFLMTPAPIILLRAIHFFEGYELAFYDFLMSNRPPSEKDKRFLIVTVDDQDFKIQLEEPDETMRGSLSDETLAELLKKAKSMNPIAIGLDVYRDYPLSEENNSALEKILREGKEEGTPIFTACKTVANQDQNEYDDNPILAPSFSLENQIGFVNFAHERDEVVRRALLAIYRQSAEVETSTSPNSLAQPKTCDTEKSFGLLVAEHFLQKEEGIKTNLKTSEKKCKISFSNAFSKDVVLPNILANTGGYQGYNNKGRGLFGGCQILLNYPGIDLRKRYDQVSLRSFLRIGTEDENNFHIDAPQNRIILIGVTRDNMDEWRIPYKPNNNIDKTDQMVKGVFIQANIISQVIDAARGERVLIHILLSPKEDYILMFVLSFIGAGVGYFALRSPSLFLTNLGIACAISLSISYFAFEKIGPFDKNYWLPLLPHTLVYLTTSSLICVLNLPASPNDNPSHSKTNPSLTQTMREAEEMGPKVPSKETEESSNG